MWTTTVVVSGTGDVEGREVHAGLIDLDVVSMDQSLDEAQPLSAMSITYREPALTEQGKDSITGSIDLFDYQ